MVKEDKLRPCTCHPDDDPPVPCAEKYALTECKNTPPEHSAAATQTEAAVLHPAAASDAATGASGVGFYRLRNRMDPYNHWIDYDAGVWELIVIPKGK